MGTRTFLTTDQVADLVQRPARTLTQWRYLGTGPSYFKVGGAVRYDLADVEAWLDAQRVVTR